jgi:prephenate dehydrogenase
MGARSLNRPEFGIVGFGRFGRFVASHLLRWGEVLVYDRRDVAGEASSIGVRSVSVAEVAHTRHLILCPPIRALADVLSNLAPYLHPRTVLIDTCSVKVEPVRKLLRATPESVDLLATHPLFGPDSAEDGLKGLKIVLCPVRRGRVRATRRFLERLGLEVIVTTPEEHDRQIAETQAVVQWIGRALERVGAGPRKIDTTGHLRLIEILRYVTRDSRELFCDMQRRNPFAAGARRRFLDALREVEEQTMEGWEVVYRAAGTTEAEIVKGYLESLDIPVDLDYESAGKVYGLTMDGLGEVRLRVPAEYAEVAREAIAQRLQQDRPRGENDGPDAA